MHLVPQVRLAVLMSGLAVLGGSAACVAIDGADFARYTEREEKTFAVSGKPDVLLSTFDGSIEIRPWDRSEVNVTIERRAASKESADTIEIQSQQTGNHVVVEVKIPRHESMGFHFDRRSAKLVVSMPAASNVIAKSGDGSIDAEGITGQIELRSGDGSIRARRLDGDVLAHSGDGSIRLDDMKGALRAEAGDGSIRAAGAFGSLRAHTGDGSVHIVADPGSAPSSDWDISTSDGSVVLALPDGFNAELDAHTGDGSVHTQDLTLSNVTGELNRHAVRGRLGSGGNTVRVRTGDGSITLKKAARTTT
jgi:DUF4097 and DUF4098 domain-containing protein YvlB